MPADHAKIETELQLYRRYLTREQIVNVAVRLERGWTPHEIQGAFSIPFKQIEQIRTNFEARVERYRRAVSGKGLKPRKWVS